MGNFIWWQKLKGLSDKNLVILLFLFTFVYFSVISIVRHFSLGSAAFDLGNIDQAIWNISLGHSAWCTMKYPQGGTLLGDHFEAIMFLIAPLYWICSNVIVLLILQPFLLAFAILPLYLIAKTVLKDRFLIFVILICYILSKSIRAIAFFDFYTESLMIPAILWAYYFLIKRNNPLLWLSLIVLLLCKEDTTFLVLGFGIFTLVTQQRRALGVSFILLAVFLWWLETGILIPHFSPTHHYDYLSKLPFGSTYADNVKFCLSHPISFIKFLLTRPKIEYITRLLGPLCFLSLLSPSHWILIFIPLFKNLLASPDKSIFYTINSHYVAAVIPFVFIGSIYGCQVVTQHFKAKNIGLIVGVCLLVSTLLFYGKSDVTRLGGFIKNMKVNHTLEKIRDLKMIPQDASVMATGNLCPQIAHRKYIYLWGSPGTETIFPDYIAIDKVLVGNDSLKPEEISGIDHYVSLARSKGYTIIASVQNNTFMILERPHS